jgi:capsular exopolysaccharide synthesis family protein
MSKKNEAYKAQKFNLLTRNSKFAVVEAYKELRTNMQFVLSTSESNACVFTSAEPDAGKSHTTANLAITIAQTSNKVLLIDADLRKPVQHMLFGTDNICGLSNILSRTENDLNRAIKRSVAHGVDLMSSGPVPPNPSELLGHKRMKALLDMLSSQYNYILLDCTPVNLVSDALMLAPYTAGVVLVARQRKTHIDSISKAAARFRTIDVNILGVVLTDVKQGGAYYNYGYY